MDSHELPRSLVPARIPLARSKPGLMVASAPDAPEAAPTSQILRVAVRGIRRYWWLVLGLWVLGSVGLGAAIFMKIEPFYESESYLRVDDKRDGLFAGTSNADLPLFLETLVQLIKSTNVLTAAGADPGVRDLPRIRATNDIVIELRKAISVRTIPGTYLIVVSMASRDPREASIIVNAVVKAFLKANREWSDSMTTKQITNLEIYFGELDSQSKELEDRWKELVRRGDGDGQVFGPRVRGNAPAVGKDGDQAQGQSDTSRATITIQTFKEVQSQFLTISRNIAAAESYVEDLRRTNAEVKPIGEGDKDRIREQLHRMFEADPDNIALTDQLLAAEAKAEEVRRVANSFGDPAERKFRAAAASLVAKREKLWQAKMPQYLARIRSNDVDPTIELRTAEARLRTLKYERSALDEQLKELRIATTKLATDDVEIALIRDARDAIKNMKDMIQRKLDDLKFSAKEGARIRLSIEAVPAGRPQSNSRMKYLAITPVGVLALVLGLAFALELRSGRVADPDFLSTRLRHEVFSIAPLPNLRPGDDGRAGRSEQKLARFVQSLDHLRVALCDGGVAGQGRCVLITSATGGEGKTTLSAHLAARCSNAGTSILLVDADLRRTSLGRLLDVPAGPGLGDVLSGDVDLEDAVQTVQAGGFRFLSAGSPGIDPSRILTTSRLAPLIERLRGMYDLVLIDSPPILPVPDALLMGRHVDGVVIASRFDASRLPLVEKASRQLAAANIPVLGMVVNGAQSQASEYGKYHYAYQYPSRHDSVRDDSDEAVG